MVKSCACYGLEQSPYSHYSYHAPNIEAVGIIFNVFSYNAVLSRHSNPVLAISVHAHEAPSINYSM